MNCRRCEVTMQPGVALQQTFTGIGDFHDNDAVCTFSLGGPGQLVSVMKCPECGHSVDNQREQKLK